LSLGSRDVFNLIKKNGSIQPVVDHKFSHL